MEPEGVFLTRKQYRENTGDYPAPETKRGQNGIGSIRPYRKVRLLGVSFSTLRSTALCVPATLPERDFRSRPLANFFAKRGPDSDATRLASVKLEAMAEGLVVA